MKGAHLLPQAYDASVDILISSLTCTKIVKGDREEGGIQPLISTWRKGVKLQGHEIIKLVCMYIL